LLSRIAGWSQQFWRPALFGPLIPPTRPPSITVYESCKRERPSLSRSIWNPRPLETDYQMIFPNLMGYGSR
jgi:hypothetical protein